MWAIFFKPPIFSNHINNTDTHICVIDGRLKKYIPQTYALRVFIKKLRQRVLVERFYKENHIDDRSGPIAVVDNDNNCPRSQCGTKPNTAVAVLGFPYRNARLFWPTFKRTLLGWAIFFKPPIFSTTSITQIPYLCY